MRTIEITFPLGESPILEVSGVQGPSCKEVSAELESLLGQTASVARKADFFESPTLMRPYLKEQQKQRT